MSGYRVPADVGWAEGSHDLAQPQVVVARLPDGPPFAMSGTARTIWTAALEGGDTASVVRRVAELADQPEEVVDADVRTLLADLVRLGLLAEGDQSSSPSR